MRQAEDAERTMADRERVLEAVKAQEAHIAVAARERDAVVDSVNKQRECMDFMLGGELRFVKRMASEDEAADDDEPQSVVVNDENVQEEEAADVPVIVDEVEDEDDESVREDRPGIETVDSVRIESTIIQ